MVQYVGYGADAKADPFLHLAIKVLLGYITAQPAQLGQFILIDIVHHIVTKHGGYSSFIFVKTHRFSDFIVIFAVPTRLRVNKVSTQNV